MAETNKKTVAERLQKMRVELQKMNLKKSGVNSFAGFNYYELADFLPTINEMLEKEGLTSNFSIYPMTINNPEAKAVLRIADINNYDEDYIEFNSPIADANVKGCTPIQSLGAVHTYMKRYLYLNAFEIIENDILDPNVGNPNTKPKASKKQLDLINSIVDNIPELLKYYNIETLEELNIEQASEVISKKKGK